MLMEKVFSYISSVFGIAELKKFQTDCLCKLYENKDVFVSYKTGSGKSLCYEAFPLYCMLNADNSGIVVLVIEPLISIMEEQTNRLKKIGFPAAYIGHDTYEDDHIKNGEYMFVFSSPELILERDEWRTMLRSASYDTKRVLIVIDEAHTVIEWLVYLNYYYIA